MRTQGGGGGQKRSNFADVLYGWPQGYLKFDLLDYLLDISIYEDFKSIGHFL